MSSKLARPAPTAAETNANLSLVRAIQFVEQVGDTLNRLWGRGVIGGGAWHVTKTAAYTVEIANDGALFDGVSLVPEEPITYTALATGTVYLWARIVHTPAAADAPAEEDTYEIAVTHTTSDVPPAADWIPIASWEADGAGIDAESISQNPTDAGQKYVDTASAVNAEVIAARGSMESLDARLDVALNEDGTLKEAEAATHTETLPDFSVTVPRGGKVAVRVKFQDRGTFPGPDYRVTVNAVDLGISSSTSFEGSVIELESGPTFPGHPGGARTGGWVTLLVDSQKAHTFAPYAPTEDTVRLQVRLDGKGWTAGASPSAAPTVVTLPWDSRDITVDADGFAFAGKSGSFRFRAYAPEPVLPNQDAILTVDFSSKVTFQGDYHVRVEADDPKVMCQVLDNGRTAGQFRFYLAVPVDAGAGTYGTYSQHQFTITLEGPHWTRGEGLFLPDTVTVTQDVFQFGAGTGDTADVEYPVIALDAGAYGPSSYEVEVQIYSPDGAPLEARRTFEWWLSADEYGAPSATEATVGETGAGILLRELLADAAYVFMTNPTGRAYWGVSSTLAGTVFLHVRYLERVYVTALEFTGV